MKVYLRIFFLMLGDYISFMGIFILTAYIYKLCGGEYELITYLKMWPFGLLFILINEIARLYYGTMFYPGVSLGPAEELRRIFYSVTVVFFGLLLFLFISKETVVYSRAVFIISWPICIFTTVICRWVLRSIFKRYEFGNVRAIILGAGIAGTKTAKLLNKNKYLGISPVAFLDDNPKLLNSVIEEVPVIATLEKLEENAKKLNADYIIACLPVTIVMDKIKEHCSSFKHIMIIPTGSMFSAVWVYAYDIGGILGLEIKCNLMLKSLLLIKQCVDYILTLLITLITIPLMILCAIFIKLTSKGAVIYKASRLGRNGEVFSIYKFRTMKTDSEKHFEQYLEDNPEAKKEWLNNFKLKKDPRITWVGNILRKTSLDELPQLFNVLRGDMSLIGPRPIVESEKKYYDERYDMISSVKPGITGLWQVSGRSELDYEERVELDCYYLMNWNIWLDVFILLKTIKEVLFCRGAY
jgi:Undecaprenyl-phosphate galactose phosphotransferase WbaP